MKRLNNIFDRVVAGAVSIIGIILLVIGLVSLAVSFTAAVDSGFTLIVMGALVLALGRLIEGMRSVRDELGKLALATAIQARKEHRETSDTTDMSVSAYEPGLRNSPSSSMGAD